jgi:hypothetical protein
MPFRLFDVLCALFLVVRLRAYGTIIFLIHIKKHTELSNIQL